jgi:hypothetical protein
MSSAYNHQLIPFTKDHVQAHSMTCSSCDEPTSHILTYQYVAGRQGRVSWADRSMCRSHAHQAAKKYGLAWEGPIPEPPKKKPQVTPCVLCGRKRPRSAYTLPVAGVVLNTIGGSTKALAKAGDRACNFHAIIVEGIEYYSVWKFIYERGKADHD